MRRFQNYIRDVIAELKGSTATVIVFSIISALFVFGVDLVLGKLVQFVLGRGI